MRYDGRYLAVLATDDEIFSHNLGNTNGYVNSKDTVQYFLKVVSTFDSPVSGRSGLPEYVTSYATRTPEIEDGHELDHQVRANSFLSQISNRLSVVSFYTNDNGYHIVDTASYEEGGLYSRYYNRNIFFRGVPIWELYESGLYIPDAESLARRVMAEKRLNGVPGFDAVNGKLDYLVYHDNKANAYYAVGPFENVTFDFDGAIRFADADDVKIIPFTDEWYTAVFQFDPEKDRILYVTPEVDHEIMKALSEAEPLQSEEKEISMENSAFFAGFSEDLQKRLRQALESAEKEKNEDRAENQDLHSTNTNEEQKFIDSFFRRTQAEGYHYSKQDLINFHTSIKTGQLVILSGMSGTGKSQLVRCYANALGLSGEENPRYRLIPVRPSWMDDSDLIGFLDIQHGQYRPADTGLVQLLLDAEKPENTEKIYLVCFDEMNLARVEHYFSQFLSILELPVEKRYLRLYENSEASMTRNADVYPPIIHIGANVRFVGTVNVDETTYRFSDKVLDRANVIELDVIPYSEWTEEMEETEDIPEITFSDYQLFATKSYQMQRAELELLWRIHRLIRSANGSTGIGPRVVKQIGLYLSNLPVSDVFDRKIALDLQITQRIMTKIRGPQEMVEAIFDGTKNNGLKSLLDEYAELSNFDITRESIRKKEQELRIYGFAL